MNTIDSTVYNIVNCPGVIIAWETVYNTTPVLYDSINALYYHSNYEAS